MFIYLDESGDLGFDFKKPATSKYFVITLLVFKHSSDVRVIEKAVKRTIKNKIMKSKKLKNPMLELKGSKTSISVKKYFYRHIASLDFTLFSVILNKRRVYESLRKRKPRLYNFITRFILEKCEFSKANCGIELVVDRCKGPGEQMDFNKYLSVEMQAQIPSNIPLRIYHNRSHENKPLQAVDLFCWGIARKWESGKKDSDWYSHYRDKIKMEELYLPPSEP